MSDKALLRQSRVNELLFRELGGTLTVILGQSLPYLLTVTGVRCSPDLRDATVYVSVYGTHAKLAQYKRDALALLKPATSTYSSPVL